MNHLVYVVCLKKQSAIGRGQEPVGAEFKVAARVGRTEEEQRRFAWRVFQRDRPDENPMNWIITEVR